MLGALVLTMFVLPPLSWQLPGGALLVDLFFFLALVSGVRVVLRFPRLATAVSVLAVANGLAKVVASLGGGFAWGTADAILSVTSILLLVWVVASQLPARGPISTHHIQGGIALYLLLGLLWSEAYGLLDRLVPGSFTFPPHLQAPDQRMQAFLYFSLVTLTTLGYGDITPATDWARSLTTSEAFTGQLFPAILIARLVSLQVAGSEMD